LLQAERRHATAGEDDGVAILGFYNGGDALIVVRPASMAHGGLDE
jgi:hypothetical protein